MKKILSLLLALLLLTAIPFTVAATEKNAPAFGEGDVNELLSPKNESCFISNGLIFDGASDGALVAEDVLTVIDRTMDAASMAGYEYDFTVMTSTRLDEEAGEHLIMSLSVLDVYATVDAEGNITAFRAAVGSESIDLVGEVAKGDFFHLAVNAKLTPSFADDGVMNRCQFALTSMYLEGVPMFDLSKENALTSLRMDGIETKTCAFGTAAALKTNAALIYERELTANELSANSIFMLCIDEGVTELYSTDYWSADALRAYTFTIFEELSNAEHTAETLKATVDAAYTAAIESDDTYDYSAYLIVSDEMSDAAVAHNALLAAAEAEDFLLDDYFALTGEDRLSLLDELASEDDFSEETYDTYLAGYLPKKPDLSNIENAMKNVISFVGYQARIDGVSAVRALFKVDLAKLKALEADYTVSFGTTLIANGTQTVEAVYGEGATGKPVYNGANEIRFATMLEAEDASIYDDSYTFGAFLTLENADGVYTLLITAGGTVLGNPISMQEICAYFAENGFADAPAISRVIAE